MSWKPEVQTDTTGKWYSNALRFATQDEALAQVTALSMRWMSVQDFRVVESPDPVKHAYVDGRLVMLDVEPVGGVP